MERESLKTLSNGSCKPVGPNAAFMSSAAFRHSLVGFLRPFGCGYELSVANGTFSRMGRMTMRERVSDRIDIRLDLVRLPPVFGSFLYRGGKLESGDFTRR